MSSRKGEHDAVGAGAAPGKVILLGEHAVVYGRPAIAATLGRGLGATAEADENGPVLHIPHWGQRGLHLRVDRHQTGFEVMERAFAAALDCMGLAGARVSVTVDGELPPGVGLGSSAAFAVAVLRALASYKGTPFGREGPSFDALIEAAAAVERIFHGTPSGLDHSVIARGGCLWFECRDALTLRPLALARPIPVVIGWTPRAGVTREVVARLRARRDTHPELYERLFDGIGELVDVGERALAAGDLDLLGTLFDLNHGYLNACGVSTPAIERMLEIGRRSGAAGAKMTGAGCGGAIIAVAPGPEARRPIVEALAQDGFEAFATELGGP